MANVTEWTLRATDETAAAFNSFNNSLNEVSKNTETVAKVSKVGFALFLGGELLGAVRNLGREMFNVQNATNKIDAQRLEGMHNSMEKAKGSFLNVAAIIGSKLAPILESVSNWFVQLIGDGEAFRQTFNAVFAGLTRAAGVFADGWRGIQVIWEVLTLAFHGFRLAVVTGLQGLDTLLVDIANKIPGVQMQYSHGLDAMAKSARESVDQSKANLHDLMMKPLPSTMMKDAVEQFDKMTGAAVKLTKEQEKARDAAAKALAKAKEQQDKELDDLVNSSFEKIQKEDEQLAASVESLRKAGLSKLQVLEEQHAAELASIQSARMRNITDEDTARQLELESLQRFNDQKAQLQKEGDDKAQADRLKSFGQYQWMAQAETAFGQNTLKSRIAGTGVLLGQMSSLMQSNKKSEFELGKKAAIANAFIGMGEGIGKAWGLPFPLNIAAVALVGAQAMMNIRQIRAQQFQGGGAANVGATPTMSVGETGLPSAPSGYQEPPMLPASSSAATPARNVVIQVESDSGMVSMDWVRNKLAPAMQEAAGDGVKFLVA